LIQLRYGHFKAGPLQGAKKKRKKAGREEENAYIPPVLHTTPRFIVQITINGKEF
jgi:hypothetical protein